MVAELGKLAVVIEAVGAKDTLDKADETTKKMAKIAARDKKIAGNISNYAQQAARSFGIIAATMAATAGLLLLKMPVIQEIWWAMGVFIDEIAYILDEVLAPALEWIIELLFYLAEKFDKLPGPIKTIIAWVVVAGAVIGVLAAAIAILITALVSMSILAIFAIFSLAFWIVVIGAVIAIVVGLYNLFNWVWPYISSLIAESIDIAIAVFEFFGRQVNTVIEFVKGILLSFVSWFWVTFGEDIQEVLDNAAKTFEFWAGVIGGVMDILYAALMWPFTKIAELWKSDFLNIKTTFENAVGTMVWLGEEVERVFNFIWEKIEWVMKKVEEVWSLVWSGLESIFTTAWDLLKLAVEAAFGLFLDSITAILALLRGDWEEVWNQMEKYVVGIVDGLGSILEGVMTVIAGAFNPIISGINAVIGALNKVSVKVPDWVPKYGGKEFGFDIDPIEEMKIGGKVTDTGVAKVHAGETVLTRQLTDMLERFFAGGGMGGGDIIIQIDGHEVGRVVNVNNQQNATTLGMM